MTGGRTGKPDTAASPPTRSVETEVEEAVSPRETADSQTEVEEAVSPRQTADPETEATVPESTGPAESVEPTAAGPAGPTAGVDEQSAADDDGIGTTLEEDASSESGGATDPVRLEQALAERTADLQRLQAEYLNYKRRVDRDRELVRENATFAALAPIVEVLDTIDRARESARSLGSELEGGLAAVADQLERVVSSAGLVKYGEPGDAFDPRLHEALSHIGEDPEVKVTTCKVIAKAGYRIGERVVRAAQVLVVDPVND